MNEQPLNQKLFDEPFEFDFFQAVRLLERLFPERAAVGRDSLPALEAVRFRSRTSLEFPASQIHDLKETNEEFSDHRKLEMFVNFMGLTGPLGVLPTPYTELLIERARYRDTAMWAFFDIFTHRAVSLFFRAWEKYRFPISYERGADDFTESLYDLIGLGTRGLRGRMDLPDESLLPYGGIIASKPHSANALRSMIAEYFDAPIEIRQFSGQWLALDEESITKLGAVNSALGVNAVVGTKVWNDQSKFRVRVGAVGFEQFKGFLPNGSAFRAVRSMIRFMVGEEFDFDLQLILKAKEVPSCILTTRAKRRPQLGWTTWLKTKKFEKDDEQIILQTP